MPTPPSPVASAPPRPPRRDQSEVNENLLAPPRWSVSALGLLVAVAVTAGVVSGSLLGGAESGRVQTAEGTAVRANDENGLILFDAVDGSQFSISAESIAWTSGSGPGSFGGQSRPPCLTQPRRPVPVTVGYLDVTAPGGATIPTVVWLACP